MTGVTLTFIQAVNCIPSRPEASLKMGPKPIFSGEAGAQGFPEFVGVRS